MRGKSHNGTSAVPELEMSGLDVDQDLRFVRSFEPAKARR